VLVAGAPFVLERIELLPDSVWEIDVEHETWVLVIAGHARLGWTNASLGEVVFLERDRAVITVGSDGLTALVAYVGPEPREKLLRARGVQHAGAALGAASPLRDDRATLSAARS
jgi:mannose-6-phosphate isomerase